MFKKLFSHRRRPAPRTPSGVTDRRGVREPDPMPRMRYP